jgi:hypothetical protein
MISSRLFRSQRHGQVKKFSNQLIETKFIFFFIPLGSYFVNRADNSEIRIPLNEQSMKAYYVPAGLITGSILGFALSLILGASQRAEGLPVILGYLPGILLFGGLCIGTYFTFQPEKQTPKEIKQRAILENVIGINALPEWLSPETKEELLRSISHKLPANWKDKIVTGKYSTEEFYLLYTAAFYNHSINPGQEAEYLFDLLDKKVSGN